MARFKKMEDYPDEIRGRFNSFITTQFDDSLSVEMQIRSLIKWINSSTDLINNIVDYINLFIEMFDERLQEEIVRRLNEWLDDGTLAQIINNDVFDMKADKIFVDTEIERLDQKDDFFDTEIERLDEIDGKLITQLAQITTNVKQFGAVGDDVTDDTDVINSVIQTVSEQGGGEVYIPDGVYRINVEGTNTINSIPNGGVQLKDNVRLVFSKKAYLKALPTPKGSYSLISLLDVENVDLINPKLIGDRDEHLGVMGEWGHGISINGSTNITIERPFVEKCWGDGIYIGASEIKKYSENVTINEPFCDNNRRQGISIVSVKDLLINKPITKNTIGIAPEAGIDIEPNVPSDKLENILIVNPISEGNRGSGIMIVPDMLGAGGTSNHISVTITNAVSTNDREGFFFAGFDELTGNIDGFVHIINPLAVRPRLSGFRAENWLKNNHPEITIDSMTVENPNGQNQLNLGNRGRVGYVIYASAIHHNDVHGGFIFKNCRTIDTRNPNVHEGMMIVGSIWFETTNENQRIDAEVINPSSNIQNLDLVRWDKGYGVVRYDEPPVKKLPGYSTTSSRAGQILQLTSSGELYLPKSNDVIGREFLFKMKGVPVIIRPSENDVLVGYEYSVEKAVILSSEGDFLKIKSLGDYKWEVLEKRGTTRILGTSRPRKIVFGSGPPTTGTWEMGDRVLNADPVSGYFEWVCTNSGTPGTWVGNGLINN